MAKEMNSTKIIALVLSAFVMIVLGVSLLGPVSSSVLGITQTVKVANESLSLAAARLPGNNINTSYLFTLLNSGDQGAGGLVLNSVVIVNSSYNIIASGNYSVTYTSYPDTISFLNTTTLVNMNSATNGNQTFVNYTYYPNGYLNQGWDNSVLNLLPGFFAIALMAVGIALMMSAFKSLGII